MKHMDLPNFMDWVERTEANDALKRAQASPNHSPAIPGIASTPLKFRYLNPTIHPFARPAWVRHLHVPNQVDPALRLQNVAELL